MSEKPAPAAPIALMAHFNRWVNRTIFGCAAGLDDGAYRADNGAYFGSIHRTLNHLLLVDRLWTRRIRGEPNGFTALDEILYDDAAELRVARVAEDDDFVALVDGLDADALGRTVRYRRMIGDGEQATRCDHVLLTLFNHQTHHRGQVHCMLTQAGVTPSAIDLVYFLETVDMS